jgi:hypothetical protein
MLAARAKPGDAVGADALRRMVEAALPVARARAELIGELRSALLERDDASALALARRVCGIPPIEEVS